MATRRLMFAALAILTHSPLARACSTCFGDPDSNMVVGAKAGVFVMVLVVYGVLLTMVGVIGTWAIRARKLNSPPTDAADSRQEIDHQ